MTAADPEAAAALRASTFRFLVTTDNHLGFQEKNPRRCRDSFVTFEECLRGAVEHDVDAILLAGDLFHDSKPSLHVMHQSLGLLRRYVTGNRPIPFSLLSDPSINFPDHPVPCANFQDPNLNIAFPVFAIHGNHDDPLGECSPSPVDILADAGLINHFGHCRSVDHIVVRPVLLQKGNTFVALYGLGSINDQRLHRCFERNQVQFLKPKEPPGVPGVRWFTILLFHQNRGIRGTGGVVDGMSGGTIVSKGGIPESMLKPFHFDVVIWGNEHEQLMVPQTVDGVDVIQPGSTVMTSLSGAECNPKQFGILEVRSSQYRITPHPLRSIRPVVRRQVELWRDQPQARSIQAVETYLRNAVDDMIAEADELIAAIPHEVLAYHPDLKFPLMRLSVDFSSPEGGPPYPQPNAHRFGQQFLDAVVNANDVLKPMKPKPRANVTAAGGGGAAGGDSGAETMVVPLVPQISTLDIRAKIAGVFNANARDACALLSEPQVASAVYLFADKGDKNAIDATIETLVVESNKSIWKTLRKAKHDLSSLKEDMVRELALKYKADTTKKYMDTVGDAFAAEEMVSGGGGAAAATAATRDDALVNELLGLGDALAGRSKYHLGVPPTDAASRSGAVGAVAAAAAAPDGEAEDAAADEEFERLVAGDLKKMAAAAGASALTTRRIPADEDDDAYRADVALVRSKASAAPGAGAGTKSSSVKRPREDAADGDPHDDVVIVGENRTAGGGGAGAAISTSGNKRATGRKVSTSQHVTAAAAQGPKLALSKTTVAPPAPPPQPSAAVKVPPAAGQGAVLSMLAQWTR